MTENTGNVATYTYDNVYGLKSESYSVVGPTVNYTYDGVGNRLTEVRGGSTTTYTYDADNRMTARGTTNYTYDANGNQATKVAGGVTTTYTWDHENRLTQVAVAGDPLTAYEYSTDGNRMSRWQGAKTFYLQDFRGTSGLDDVLAEYNATGVLIARYVHGPGIDEPLGMVRSGTFYFTFDALGSATRLTTTAQGTNARYRYEAFGAARDTSEGTTNAYRFTARELDPTASLHYYRARWYDPGAARFLSKDPVGIGDGPNLFGYVHNRGPNSVDPTGTTHFCRTGWDWFWCSLSGNLYWCWIYSAWGCNERSANARQRTQTCFRDAVGYSIWWLAGCFGGPITCVFAIIAFFGYYLYSLSRCLDQCCWGDFGP